jgi:hypothetical protein
MWPRATAPLNLPRELEGGANGSLIVALLALVREPEVAKLLQVSCGVVPRITWTSPCDRNTYRNSCQRTTCHHALVATREPAPTASAAPATSTTQDNLDFTTNGLYSSDLMTLFLEICLARARSVYDTPDDSTIEGGIYGIHDENTLWSLQDRAVWRIFWGKFMNLWETLLRARWNQDREAFYPAFTAQDFHDFETRTREHVDDDRFWDY